ncbi:MAG: hypothetical protein LBI56_00570 [Puniceicoccales bacterium]|jgi:hypothetical protein|nr:hypothetical protein [Puniceicoccales bacterium]
MRSTSKNEDLKETKGEEIWPLPKKESSIGRSTGAVKKTKVPCVSIVADADVGFGNYLYIRGDGYGLSWDRGIQMDPISSSSWQWKCSCDCEKKCFEFKVLVNDIVWSTGENFVAIGEKNEISPKF